MSDFSSSEFFIHERASPIFQCSISALQNDFISNFIQKFIHVLKKTDCRWNSLSKIEAKYSIWLQHAVLMLTIRSLKEWDFRDAQWFRKNDVVKQFKLMSSAIMLCFPVFFRRQGISSLKEATKCTKWATEIIP